MDSQKEEYNIVEKLKYLSNQLEQRNQIIENLNSQLEQSRDLVIKLNEQIEEQQNEGKHIKNLLKSKIDEIKKSKEETENLRNQIKDYKTQLISSKIEMKNQLEKLKQIYDEKVESKELEHINYQLELKQQLDMLDEKSKPITQIKQEAPKRTMVFDSFEEEPIKAKERKIQEIIDTIKLAQQHGDTDEGIKLSLLNMGHTAEHINEAIKRMY